MCPVCHVAVRPADFFCYNCGKNLHEKPLVTTKFTEYLYYAGSFLLPPLGLWWGFRYLKQADARSRMIGWICVILTIVSSVVVTVWSVHLFQGITAQVNEQLQGVGGAGGF